MTFRIVESQPNVRLLLLHCDCGHEFHYPSDRWGVTCPRCNCWEALRDIRERRTAEIGKSAMVVLVLAVATLLLPLVARAGERQTSVVTPRASVAKPLVVYSLSIGADLAATAWVEARGGVEVNPVLQDRTTRYALSAAGVAALTLLDVKLQKSGHHGWARALRIAAVVGRGYATAHNIRQATR